MDRLSLLVRAKISIHASAKEATSLHMLIHLSYLDFNPRLREGGDNGWLYIQTLQRNFNPRLREGGDSKSPALISPLLISIHASAKEATDAFRARLNPWRFQSTPPRRRRPCLIANILSATNFNPRLREGGDETTMLRSDCMTISIHASAKEATHWSRGSRRLILYFNPRLREGGDPFPACLYN